MDCLKGFTGDTAPKGDAEEAGLNGFVAVPLMMGIAWLGAGAAGAAGAAGLAGLAGAELVNGLTDAADP